MRAKHRIFAHLSNSHYFRAARLDIPVVKLMMVTDEIGTSPAEHDENADQGDVGVAIGH